jgi:hypothetical protein
MVESRRYLGLELSGAKNKKTALAALEFYPKEKKVFLLDIYEKIAGQESGESADVALLELINELRPEGNRKLSLGVNVPLELPPCLTACTHKTCSPDSHCRLPAVKWMHEATKKARRSRDRSVRVLEFTPYTQRPIELWIRYNVLPKLPEPNRFEIDETLGGNRAPLTARMHFLKRHIREVNLQEVWPKLTVGILAHEFGINRRIVSGYRHLEEGIHAREVLLDTLVEKHGIFIYERDIRKLSQNLTSFDAFICAYTALLSDSGRCAKVPAGFPVSSGWIAYPEI